MKVVLREDESGISEVIGTILILAMTVVLFSTIIIWVSSIPTPVSQGRLDVASEMDPIYNGAGSEIGVNVTLTHQGGEALQPTPTIIYVTSQRGSNPAKTDVLWTALLTPPAGSRPPVFVDKWADGLYSTTAIDPVQSGIGFFVFAQVADPDGDLNVNSVYATITAWYGTGDPCAQPQKMTDSGVYPDRAAGDGIFSLGGLTCMKSPYPALNWDTSIILFNATDKKGHATQSRLILGVIPGPTGGGGGGGGNGTGRPANLRWNGRQGYNIFNASQWDQFKYTAQETRTFNGNEEVVVVVGSLDLENTFDTDRFTLYDPFGGSLSQPVVYGNTKTVTQVSTPSTSQGFTFIEFINGYYIYSYRFKLNAPSDPQVGTNFYKVPAHPPQ